MLFNILLFIAIFCFYCWLSHAPTPSDPQTDQADLAGGTPPGQDCETLPSSAEHTEQPTQSTELPAAIPAIPQTLNAPIATIQVPDYSQMTCKQLRSLLKGKATYLHKKRHAQLVELAYQHLT